MIRINRNLDGIVLSCDLHDIIINTDSPYLDVTFSIGVNTVLSERYYAYDNMVIVPNVSELFEQWMHDSFDSLNFECTINATDGRDSFTKKFNYFYCDKDLGIVDPELFFERNFLSLAKYVRMKPDDVIHLSWYDASGLEEGYYIQASFIDSQGRLQTYAESRQLEPTSTGYKYLLFDSGEFRKEVEHHLEEPVRFTSLVLSVGSRSLTIFFDAELSASRQFLFLNCFNQVERLDLMGTTTDKLSTESSLAVVSKIRTKYDVTHSTQFETETAPLTTDEELLIRQMLTSPIVKTQFGNNDIRYSDFEDAPHILITDYTCELSDSVSELNKVKFTWQFADSAGRIATSSGRVFTDTYNRIFG